MKLRILSDVHCEFWKDDGKSLFGDPVTGFPRGGILVLGGDIHSDPIKHREIISNASDLYDHVFFVMGNHEYYIRSPQSVLDFAYETAALHSNITLLDRTVNSFGKAIFMGCTLWYEIPDDIFVYENRIGDWDITDYRRFVDQQHRLDVQFLKDNVHELDPYPVYVVTHMLPHRGSVHPKYRNADLNKFFYVPVDDLVGHPGLWIHGHTHEHMDYQVYNTRVLANPMGYPGENNGGFREDLISLDIDV